MSVEARSLPTPEPAPESLATLDLFEIGRAHV